MSKRQAAGVIVAMAMVGMPLLLTAGPAFAANQVSLAGVKSITVISSDRHEDGDDEDDDEGEEYEHGSGYSHEEEHENHGYIPPVVIKPHEDDDADEDDETFPNGGLTPVPSASATPSALTGSSLPDGATLRGGRYDLAPVDPTMETPEGFKAQVNSVDPQAAPAIDVAGIKTTAKTPADIFMESATLGLSAMGVGALAFGGVASVRAIRVRKNPKADYFYDGEK